MALLETTDREFRAKDNLKAKLEREWPNEIFIPNLVQRKFLDASQ